MADFNPIFEVDAGKILAKLHLAGLSQVKDCIVVNTAIKNPDKSADPTKPGKVEFDLENKTGEYLLAILRPLEYNVPIDPMKNKEYVKAKEALDKFMKDHEKDLPKNDEKAEGKEESKDKEEKKDSEAKQKEKLKKDDATSLTDKTAKKKTEVNDSLKMKSFLQYITEDEDKPDQKLLDELKKLQEPLITIYEAYNLEGYKTVEGKVKDDKFDYDASAKLFEETLTKINEERVEQKKKFTEECKKAALTDLRTYFTNFAGKDNQAKIKDADIVVKNATAEGHVKDPKEMQDKIKDFKLEVDDVDAQIQKNQDELLQKPKEVVEKKYEHDVALVVGYTIDID